MAPRHSCCAARHRHDCRTPVRPASTRKGPRRPAGGRRLPGRAVRRRTDAHEPHQHRRGPPGPRLGRRGRQLPPQELRPADPPPGRRPHRRAGRRDGPGQGEQGRHLLPGAGPDRSAIGVRHPPGGRQGPPRAGRSIAGHPRILGQATAT
jgi:hypothetical protein